MSLLSPARFCGIEAEGELEVRGDGDGDLELLILPEGEDCLGSRKENFKGDLEADCFPLPLSDDPRRHASKLFWRLAVKKFDRTLKVNFVR